VREGVNRLLPVASIGDNLVGIRLVMTRGLPGAVVAASVLVEVLLTLFNQYGFIALGIVLSLGVVHESSLAGRLLLGVVLMLPLPIGLALLLRHGSVFTRLERFMENLVGGHNRLAALLSGSARLDDAVRALMSRPPRLLAAAGWQQAGMIVGAVEVWLALRLLGHPVSVALAITLESLTLGVRSLAFVIPGALGVQEAALMLVGPLLGIDAELALSLSLAKRMREVLFGVPVLISWQWFEARRLGGTLDTEAAPVLGFMRLRDIGLFARSARSDAAIERLRAAGGARHAFETIYRETGDPWASGSEQYYYQRHKYDRIVALLPQRRFARALDVGCGLGLLSGRLAARADEVLGIDIAESALALARNRHATLPNLRFEQADLQALAPGTTGSFDLIVFADTLYYLDRRDEALYATLATRAAALLAPGGMCVLVNHYFFWADPDSRLTRRIHRAFASCPQLGVAAEHRRAFFLMTVLARREAASR
jgi:putative membrane protein